MLCTVRNKSPITQDHLCLQRWPKHRCIIFNIQVSWGYIFQPIITFSENKSCGKMHLCLVQRGPESSFLCCLNCHMEYRWVSKNLEEFLISSLAILLSSGIWIFLNRDRENSTVCHWLGSYKIALFDTIRGAETHSSSGIWIRLPKISWTFLKVPILSHVQRRQI